MQDFTRKLWGKQNQHPGDRLRLFRAANRAIDATTALYPGSYVDIAASFVFPSVTYVDSDERAARFFSDSAGVEEIIAQHAPLGEERSWEFIRADYTTDLGLPDAQCPENFLRAGALVKSQQHSPSRGSGLGLHPQ